MTDKNSVWTKVLDNNTFVAVNFIPDSDEEQKVELQLWIDQEPEIVTIKKDIQTKQWQYWEYKVWWTIKYWNTEKTIYINEWKYWEFIGATLDKDKKIYINIEEDNKNGKRWKVKIKQLDAVNNNDNDDEVINEEVIF